MTRRHFCTLIQRGTKTCEASDGAQPMGYGYGQNFSSSSPPEGKSYSQGLPRRSPLHEPGETGQVISITSESIAEASPVGKVAPHEFWHR